MSYSEHPALFGAFYGGTLPLCALRYEQYSTINREDIEILPD